MKEFQIDKQTKNDLQIFSDQGASLLDCLNCTISNGGDFALRSMIDKPLIEELKIQERVDTIKFLINNVDHLAFDKTTIDFVEYYLDRPDKPQKFTRYKAIKNIIKKYLSPTSEYYTKRRGVQETVDTIAFLLSFCNEFCVGNSISFYKDFNIQLRKFCEIPVLFKLINGSNKRLNRYEIEYLDFIFRKKMAKELVSLVSKAYELDALYAVSTSAKRLNLVFQQFDSINELLAEGLFHPYIKNPVSNDVELNREINLGFLTGANMSGKSTFLKSLALSVYMAHLGFPVAACKMRLPYLDGIYTTINLPDNIALGDSHFSNEVKRVKLISEKLKEGNQLLIIFDEFFRGTNVKDAYEATLKITSAFSAIKSSFFYISTHIVEVANALNANKNISFKYFKTHLTTDKAIFDYKLLNGITDDHIGIWILEKEGVFEILRSIKPEKIK